MKKLFNKIISKLTSKDQIKSNHNETKLLLGRILTDINHIKRSKSLKDYEAKIFSQFGEDGIIDFLIKELDIKKDKFIEIGIENYEESNTRFLLESKNWTGLIIDSSQKYVDYIKKQNYYWRNNITAKYSFVTEKNINKIIKDFTVKDDVGLLSIDIDGNDYWIWKKIENLKPDIVIMEYNARLGTEKSISIPYDENFERIKKHHSSIYFGCSLKALCNLGKVKGYSLVYTNMNGNNAFFINSQILKNSKSEIIRETSPEECFSINSFNELRDIKGNILERNKESEDEILKNCKFENV